jgi:hypothetical protein
LRWNSKVAWRQYRYFLLTELHLWTLVPFRRDEWSECALAGKLWGSRTYWIRRLVLDPIMRLSAWGYLTVKLLLSKSKNYSIAVTSR